MTGKRDVTTSILTCWGRVMQICVSKLTISGSDNGFSPVWCQAITWTIADLLLIEPLGTNVSEIWKEIPTFSFKKMHLKMSSGKWRPFCLGLNVLRMSLTHWIPGTCSCNVRCAISKQILVHRPSGSETRYSSKMRSISQLQIPWLLALPGHLQPKYWLFGKKWLSSTREVFQQNASFQCWYLTENENMFSK